MNFVLVMKKLSINKDTDKSKLWFFKINNFIKNDNLRLYSLKLDVIKKNLSETNLNKLPDPKEFAIGINFVSSPEKLITQQNNKKSIKIIISFK